MTGRGRGRRKAAGYEVPTGSTPRFPRTARVNEVLREVVADELERIDDERLELLTVMGVSTDPDLRRAVVWCSSLSEEASAALGEYRVRLQAAVGRQVRLKRTPGLDFRADPAVATGTRVESILRDMGEVGNGRCDE
ncbi:MAG: ribosome-binding factor A [Acidimicrobiales bacterium]